ncbi:MAG: helix-turn-helix transcriptional regulator [Leptolyngbyaceae cyanobacterium SM2_5_2]|nr:helix-turn-helix transcriptional regulator [Leptolyngbyaceae cyanobacterium SM2_5_2]
MALILKEADLEELYQSLPMPPSHPLAQCNVEVSRPPERLGRGCTYHLELAPGLWLTCFDEEFHQDFAIQCPVHPHVVQCLVLLSGLGHTDGYPILGGERSYFSGSGISPSCKIYHRRSQRQRGIDIHLLPEVFTQFYSGLNHANDTLLKVLLKSDDWKVSFFPTMTQETRRLAQQIFQVPFQGAIQRINLQAKVLDLLALQLQPILQDERLCTSTSGRKPDTIARIYHAQEILLSRLDQPPWFLELAQQVGLSDRTLRRGFHDIFGTTVVGYLTQQRMKQAEQMLREGRYTVAEVANWVGYSHLGHFAAGFKRQFGILPGECLSGHAASN